MLYIYKEILGEFPGEGHISALRGVGKTEWKSQCRILNGFIGGLHLVGWGGWMDDG